MDPKLDKNYISCLTGKPVLNTLFANSSSLRIDDKNMACGAVVLDPRFKVYGVTKTRCDASQIMFCDISNSGNPASARKQANDFRFGRVQRQNYSADTNIYFRQFGLSDCRYAFCEDLQVNIT